MKTDPKASSRKEKKLIYTFINSHIVHSKSLHLSERLPIMPYFKPDLNLQYVCCSMQLIMSDASLSLFSRLIKQY